MTDHFLDARCTYSLNRLPLVTLAIFITNVVFYYQPVTRVSYSTTSPIWYSSLSYAFFHSDASHLWNNMVIFLISGTINESIGGNGRMLVLVLASIPIAASGHGLYHENGVVGASGIVFAVIVYQLTLVLKNWNEMRTRLDHRNFCVALRSMFSDARARVTFAVLLLISEILVAQQQETNISHATHAFGALSGACLSAAICVNTKLDWWEFAIPWIGVALYVLLVVVAFLSNQKSAGLFSFVPLPFVILYACKETSRWKRTWKISANTRRIGIHRR